MSVTGHFQIGWKRLSGIVASRDNRQMQNFLEGAISYGFGRSSYRGGQSPPITTQSFLEAYNKMPWVRGICGKIAFAGASCPWKLFVVKRQMSRNQRRVADVQEVRMLQTAGAEGRRKALREKHAMGMLEAIETHPLLDVLSHPNSEHTGMAVRKMVLLNMDLVGEIFLLKQRNALGMINGLWPMPGHWVQETPTPTRPNYHLQVGSFTRHVPQTEVLWLRDPDLQNPYGRGHGFVDSVADELEIDSFAAKMLKQVFFNQARPDYVVSPQEGSMQETEVQRLERSWTDTLQGFYNAFKPIFVRKPVNIKEFSHNFRDLELTALRKHQRDVVMQVFGVPPEIMGVLTSSNRATISAADFLFAKHIVVPRLEMLRAQLQTKLVPEYDERIILDYESPVDEDKEFKLEACKARPETPTIDEWRRLQGLEPITGGNGGGHLVTMGQTVVDELSTDALLGMDMGEDTGEETMAYKHVSPSTSPVFPPSDTLVNKY